MADTNLTFFTDEKSTPHSRLFRFAASPGEDQYEPETCVVVGWNPNTIAEIKAANSYMDLFIPEYVYYKERRVYVKGIYDHAFNGHDSELNYLDDVWEFNKNRIRTLHLPEGIEYIGKEAFTHCQSLSYVNLPDSLTRIGNAAFLYCLVLQTKDYDGVTAAPCPGYLHIPYSVASFSGAFSGCSGLTLVEIGDANSGSQLTDAEFSFSNCTNLKTLRCFVKNGSLSIKNYCFQNCENLTTIEIPYSFISSIGDYAFKGCQKITTIAQMEPSANPLTGVECSVPPITIGKEAFKDCVFLTKFPLQSEITSLGMSAFEGCQYLQEITLGNSMTEIPERAFAMCASLGTITIPRDCSRIGRGAFVSCNKLRDIFIISSADVTNLYIDDYAFSGCINLQRLWLLASNFNSIICTGNPFDGYTVNPNKSLILNSAFTQGWDESEYVSYETAFNTYWKVSPTKETVLFTPTTNNQDGLTFILELNRPTFSSLTGTATLVGILNQRSIQTSIIDLPSSVTSGGRTYTINKIGDKTFAYNYRISKIRIPNSITEIGNMVFECCSNLQEISSITSASNFPVTKIGNGAFAHCRKLSKINSTENKLNNLQYIGKEAFVCCDSLGKINLGTNYNGPIPERAFAYCGNLRVSKKSTTTYTTQSTAQGYDNTTFAGTTPTFVSI